VNTKNKYYGFLVVVGIVLLLSICQQGQCQKQRMLPINLADYDEATYHFGFTLTANMMYLTLRPEDDYRDSWHPYQEELYWMPIVDSLKYSNIQTVPTPGFSVGIVANLRLTDYLDLRVVPGMTFSWREVRHDFITVKNGAEGTHIVKDDVESVFIDLPFMLKYKAMRINNFRPYVITGLEYKYDLLSNSKKRNEMNAKQIVKLSPNDIYFTIGAGFDFYMFWFKLGVELRMAFGTFDLLKRQGIDDNFATASINALRSKQFNIIFTFE